MLDVVRGLLALWPAWLLVGAFILVEFLMVRIEQWTEQWIDGARFARAGLKDIKRMSGEDFEKYLEHLFRGVGYGVERTPYQGDYGVDLVLTTPKGRRIAVQAKRWKGKKVRVDAVQQVVGGAAHYGCHETIVVATSGYTEQARNLARSNNTRLLGLRELGEYMDQVKARQAVAKAQKPLRAAR
ncbi:MAG: restriction endonuclease [Ignavibacteriales bacterium]